MIVQTKSKQKIFRWKAVIASWSEIWTMKPKQKLINSLSERTSKRSYLLKHNAKTKRRLESPLSDSSSPSLLKFFRRQTWPSSSDLLAYIDWLLYVLLTFEIKPYITPSKSLFLFLYLWISVGFWISAANFLIYFMSCFIVLLLLFDHFFRVFHLSTEGFNHRRHWHNLIRVLQRVGFLISQQTLRRCFVVAVFDWCLTQWNKSAKQFPTTFFESSEDDFEKVLIIRRGNQIEKLVKCEVIGGTQITNEDHNHFHEFLKLLFKEWALIPWPLNCQHCERHGFSIANKIEDIQRI